MYNNLSDVLRCMSVHDAEKPLERCNSVNTSVNLQAYPLANHQSITSATCRDVQLDACLPTCGLILSNSPDTLPTIYFPGQCFHVRSFRISHSALRLLHIPSLHFLLRSGRLATAQLLRTIHYAAAGPSIAQLLCNALFQILPEKSRHIALSLTLSLEPSIV